jgi:hypothetical protein
MNVNQRKALARIAHPKHLDSLVKDEDTSVRVAVAEHGTDTHRDALVKDPAGFVRLYVARHGNEKHAKKLLKDKIEEVADEAHTRLYGPDG